MVNPSVVVTTINHPNKSLNDLANGCKRLEYNFYIVGDKKSPTEFYIEGATFLSLGEQLNSEFAIAANLPLNHYSRKNLGYLAAISSGSKHIIETDDDNIPLESFWNLRQQKKLFNLLDAQDWTNVYQLFTDLKIWPRGFPLNKVAESLNVDRSLIQQEVDSPIQQGLANKNPDVDAVYRLLFELPVDFKNDYNVALAKGSWCPFNSQNTLWWEVAFPLLYLPSFCSFRMTDIWRSFIAQRICWENGWNVCFFSPTVYQDRNEHNLMKDFEDEIQGYLHNEEVCKALSKLELKSGTENIGSNLFACYETFIGAGLIEEAELGLLGNWIEDIKKLGIEC